MKKMIVAIVMAIAMLIPAPAHAKDTTGCVTRYETMSLPSGDLSRVQVEKAWEVVGLGHKGIVGATGWPVIKYSACETKAYAFAIYGKDGFLDATGYVR